MKGTSGIKKFKMIFERKSQVWSGAQKDSAFAIMAKMTMT